MDNVLNKLKKIKWKHYINYIVIGIITLVLAILTAGNKVSPIYEVLLIKIATSIILAVSLGLIVGFLGELSLGHAGFMCIGAYLGGKISSLIVPTIGNNLLSFIISLLVGGITATIFGIIIGLPALRLKGDYLAIVTLAFGEIVKTIFQNSKDETFGGAIGLETPVYDKKWLFVIGFVIVLLMLFIVQNLIRSKHGRAITAIRDSEIAAKATGINVTFYKLFVFAIAAFFAGMAGVLYSYTYSRVDYASFDYNYSIEILVMVVLGGMGNINGSIISASLITYLQVKLGTVLTGDLAVLQDIIYALVLVLIVIYNNSPKLKGFREKYNIKNLIQKIFKKSQDASYVKDDEAKWDRVPTKIEMNEILSVDLDSETSTKIPDDLRGMK